MSPKPPRPFPTSAAARTTIRRDGCRRYRAWRSVRRGGRPRTSNRWRSILALLLPRDEPQPPAPGVPPTPILATLDTANAILIITFDSPLDTDNSDVQPAQLRYGDAATQYSGTAPVVVGLDFVSVTMLTPPDLPLGAGAWLTAGPGHIRGTNGAPVPAFGPL